MRVTIKDVARHAKVSQTTVSLVLNDAPGVSTATRAHVLAVMKQLDYKPDSLARSFSSRRAAAVALVMPPWREAFDDPYFTRLLQGVLEAVRNNGYKLLLEVADARFVEQKLWHDLFAYKRVDGLIIATPQLDQDYLVDLAAHGHPALLLNGERPDLPNLDFVGYDDFRCGLDATYYLIGLGHRRIAHLAGQQDQASAVNRLLGYREALSRARIPFRAKDVLKCQYIGDGVPAAMRTLLARPEKERPTALYCANDSIALEAIKKAQAAGLRVPRDLSVIGVDDTGAAAKAEPPLTTMRQEIGSLACFAAERFIQKLEQRSAPPRLEEHLPMELVERATCAPPGQSQQSASPASGLAPAKEKKRS